MSSPPRSSSGSPDPSPEPLSLDPASLEVPSANELRVFYVLFLGALGLLNTYLPLALQGRGLSIAQISTLFALPPIMKIVAPSVWGYVADRFRVTGFLLRLACWGAFVTYLPMLTGSYVLVGVSLALHTFFRTPGGVLADALVFRRVARSGGSYGEIRAWGTVGYVLVTLAGGYLAERLGAGWVVTSGTVMLLPAALLTHRLPRPVRSPAQPIGPAMRTLLTRPAFLAFLAATMLHTVGQATYDAFFPVHLQRLGVPSHVIGWAISLGAAAEVLVMMISRNLIARVGTTRLFIFTTAVGLIRWVLNAVVIDPTWLIAIQALHGLTFGAWYVAAATYVNEHTPPEIRASGQGLLSVASFGSGGVLAMLLSGVVGSRYGTGAQFWACAVCSGLAFLLAIIGMREKREEVT